MCRISENSIDSFVIRVFHERHRAGFIKAFSDDAEFLAINNRLERVLRSLYLKKLFLWPRFRFEVTRALEGENEVDIALNTRAVLVPEVVELNLSLTKHMHIIQSAILVAMNTTIAELKKSLSNNTHIQLNFKNGSNEDSNTGGQSNIDTSQWTLENGLFHNFDYYLRQQLDLDWHKITSKNKQLINDLSVLRKLLDYLVRYDALSFYYLLKKLQQSTTTNITTAINSNTNSSSLNSNIYSALWIFTAAADEIFKHAKERVYAMKPLISVHNSSGCARNSVKWDNLPLFDRSIVEAKSLWSNQSPFSQATNVSIANFTGRYWKSLFPAGKS